MNDDQHFPDVVIAGNLALALLDTLEWAGHRTREGEDTARGQFAQMTHALEREIRDVAPAPRWVLPEGASIPPDVFADAADRVWSVTPADLVPYRAVCDQAVKRIADAVGLPEALRPTTGEALPVVRPQDAFTLRREVSE